MDHMIFKFYCNRSMVLLNYADCNHTVYYVTMMHS